MSGFKNLLKSDTPTGSQSTALGGQGSHFSSRRDDEPPFATRAADADVVGSTVTGTEPSTAGPSDTSAAPAPVSQAYNTAGPEAGGSSHIGTTSASSSAALPGDRSAAQTSRGPPGSTTYNFPQTLRSGDNTSSGPSAATGTGANTGSAAIGQTTTYSSRPLASGDPTGSVIDHQSTDPLTYKLPEAGSHHATATGTGNSATSTGTSPTGPTSSSVVTSSAAATAASAAWNTHNRQERMPGEFPSDGSENPYRATNLDPRVDGGKPRAPTTQASSGIPSHTRDSTLGSSTSGVASGLGTSYNERSVPSAAHEHSGRAPSTLTSTADPAARAAQYATSANTRVPDTTSTTTTQSQHTGEQQGFMGRALDAVGLGNAANATAGYLGYGAVAHGNSGSTEPRDTSAIATQPGMVAQESGPPRHYRRESIPTTAYPSTDAARPIAAPVGGTLDARRSIDRGVGGSNTGISNERGIGGTPATTQGVTTGSGFGLGSENSGVPRQEYSESSRVRDNIGTSGTHDSHTGRNVAAGGAAAAATGAGIHGLQHQGRSDDLRSSAAEDARRDDTLSGGHSYTIGSGGPAPMDAISSRDPNSRSAGLQGTGLGSSTSASRPMDAVAAAPGRYDGQDYSSNTRTGSSAIGGSGEQSLRRDDHSHSGRDAALGASAAAAAIYATGDRGHHGTIHDAITVGTPTTTDASTRGTSTGQSTIDSRHYDVHGAHDSSSYGTSTGYGTAGTTGITGTHGTHGTTGTTGLSSHGTSAGYGTTGLSTGGASTTVPSSYGTSTGYGTAPTHDTTTLGDRNLRQEGDHTGRNVGLGAAAGTAAGGAAYAAHDRHNEKEIEKQRSHAEKEERKHHKEVEKEEKRQQKEMDKEEKEHAAAAEKREHARLAAEEEDRKRRERESAAGVAPLTQTGMVSHDPHAHEKEKKPSIFKRIFKRRQNKDTGEEEEYSSDDEEDKARHYAAGGSSVPVHHSDEKGRTVLGHGRDKEAYREQPAWRGPVTDVAAENSMNTPGRPHPGAEERLGYQPGSTSAGYSPSSREGGAAAISGATAGGVSSGYGASDQRTGHLGSGTTGLTSGSDSRPHDTYTGLPYDPSKDPSTAARLSEHEQGGLTGRSGTTGSGHILGSEPLGEITDHRR